MSRKKLVDDWKREYSDNVVDIGSGRRSRTNVEAQPECQENDPNISDRIGDITKAMLGHSSVAGRRFSESEREKQVREIERLCVSNIEHYRRNRMSPPAMVSAEDILDILNSCENKGKK